MPVTIKASVIGAIIAGLFGLAAVGATRWPVKADPPVASTTPAALECTSPWTPWKNAAQCVVGPSGHCSNLLRAGDHFKIHLATLILDGAGPTDQCQAARGLSLCVKSSVDSGCIAEEEACAHANTVGGPWSERGLVVTGSDLTEGLAVEIREGSTVIASKAVAYSRGLQEIALCEGGMFKLDANPKNVKSFTYYLERPPGQ